MALNRTTLSAALGANDLFASVASTSGMSAGQHVRINDEFALIAAVTNSTTLELKRRGNLGTTAKAHNARTGVVAGDPGDFPAHAVGQDSYVPVAPRRVTYGAAGAIAIPDEETTVVLDGTGALAMTLANPTTAQDGLRVTIVSNSAHAHTVTNTSGFLDNTTLSDVATFAANAGASMTIEARNGKWGVIALASVTLG